MAENQKGRTGTEEENGESCEWVEKDAVAWKGDRNDEPEPSQGA